MSEKYKTKLLLAEESIIDYVSFALSEQFQLGLIQNETFDFEKVRKISLKADGFRIETYPDYSATFTGEDLVHYVNETVLLIPVQGSVAHVIDGVGDSHNECLYKFDYDKSMWLEL